MRRLPPARILLAVASAGGLALLVYSIAVEPLPLGAIIAAFAFYAGIAVAGTLVPQLEMYGDVLWRGPRSTRAVVLTFDDGPNPATTYRVLEALERGRARATFFVIGEKAERHPEIVRAIVQAGHDVGVHGFQHDRLYSLKSPRAIAADLSRACGAVERASGIRPRWFRPPIGHVSPRTVKGAELAGLTIVGWSVRGLDGLATATPARVAKRVLRGLDAGAIVLLHDAAERDDRVPASLEALPLVLSEIERRNFETAGLEAFAGADKT